MFSSVFDSLRIPGAALAIAAVLTAPAARAAPATADGYWQDTRAITLCNFASCVMDFSKVPSGKQIIITNVNCALAINGGGALQNVELGAKDSQGIPRTNFTFLKPVSNGVNGANTFYSISDSVIHVLQAHDRAHITINNSSGTVNSQTGGCTISGLIK